MSEVLAAHDRTFAVIKASRFQGVSAEFKKDLLYLEQLASATNVNIDGWDTDLLGVVPRGDKRAINKLFFDRVNSNDDTKKALEAFEPVLKEVEAVLKNRYNRVVRTIDQEIQYCLDQSNAYLREYNGTMTRLHQQRIQKDAISQRGVESMRDEMLKVIKNRFWTYNSRAGNVLYFHTTNDVILSEVNAAAGVNRRINFGRYKVSLNLETCMAKVLRHERNITTTSYYHPYVSSSGEICWGNAGQTATNLSKECKYGDYMDLLAGLLSNYAPDTTPYYRLSDFATHVGNDGTQAPQEHGSMCEHCDQPEDDCECERCDTCSQVEDDCDCHYCEACDVRYADGDSCEGHFCERCGECAGSDPCERHYCETCESYTLRDGVCDDGCCRECEETNDNCDRCRECDQHDGHDSGCSNAPQPESEASF